MGRQGLVFSTVFCLCFLTIIFLSGADFSFAAEGFSFDSEYLYPGKADYHYLHIKGANRSNFIWWSPVFKGGAV